ncbi:MAG: hypothetical protein EA384_16590 [Spirochaetaceae bacterium]|nr:MAG: hypothetical protein EA384_16590 [Spirochaetaceae bacterium]
MIVVSSLCAILWVSSRFGNRSGSPCIAANLAVRRKILHYALRSQALSLQTHITTQRIRFFEPRVDRDTALNCLIELVCNDFPELDRQEVTRRVFDRESSVSSSLGGGVALPHAVLDRVTHSILALGISRDGISWDADSDQPVHLVVLLVGGRIDHLRILSEVAGQLRDGARYQEIISARDASAVMSRFVDARHRIGRYYGGNSSDISRLTFERACSIAEELPRAKIVLHADAIQDPDYVVELVGNSNSIVLTNSESRFSSAYKERLEVITIPFKGMRRSTHVQFALLFLLSLGRIERDDMIVNVFGVPESGCLDSIRLTHIGSEFDFPMQLQSGRITTDVTEHVLTRALQIAGDLAVEGREGNAVGTLFVLGDFENVRGYTRQLIMNPFYGYDEIERSILDPSLEETIKEFAKIDGAFIVRGDGVLESGGTYLIGQPAAEEHQSGLGARHAAALGISTVTRAISIAVSESTRKISIFHNGRRIIFM